MHGFVRRGGADAGLSVDKIPQRSLWGEMEASSEEWKGETDTRDIGVVESPGLGTWMEVWMPHNSGSAGWAACPRVEMTRSTQRQAAGGGSSRHFPGPCPTLHFHQCFSLNCSAGTGLESGGAQC